MQSEEIAMGSGSGSGRGRSVVEKEKTKMRERQRRSITTNIFNGLRKHGGYPLSPRADINEVLRHLATEAGWVVDPDGATYRSTNPSATVNAPNLCPLCGAGISNRTPTPTSSAVIGGGGDCSTAASPGRSAVGDSMVMMGFGGPTSPYYGGASSSDQQDGDNGNPLALYMYRRLAVAGGINQPSVAAAARGGGPSLAYDHPQQQLMYLQEARASNQNTPVVSPRRRRRA